MRIHYLINGLNGGGAAFPLIDVIGLMRAAGHEVRLSALMPQDLRALPRLNAAGIECDVLGRGPRDYVRSARALLRRLRADRPDLLWTSLTRATLYGQVAGRMLDIPVVSWQHNAFLKPGNRALLRRTKRLTRRWVADSESVARFACAELGIARERIDIWSLFVARADQAVAQAWNGIGPFRIGSLGRLHPNKQYEILIRALARIRELDAALYAQLEVVVAGSGDEQGALDALAAELNVERIRFVGFVEATADFLAGLHAYVQPSRNEGLCIAAHEAMLAALPVVTTPVGELQFSVLDGTTGYLRGIGDIDGFAQALIALVRDPAGAHVMGQAARARVLARFGHAQFEASGRALLQRLERELCAANSE